MITEQFPRKCITDKGHNPASAFIFTNKINKSDNIVITNTREITLL